MTAVMPTQSPAEQARPGALRVLQLGSGNLLGGIEACQQTLARNRWSSPEMHQEYAYCFSGKAAQELRRTGVAVHLLGGARYSRPWTVVAARTALRRLLDDNGYDVVVCHELWVYGIFAPVVRRAGTPLVLWVHDRHGSGGALEYLARRTPPDAVVANSTWSADSLARFLPAVPSAVVYCPVESDPPTSGAGRSDLRRRFDTADGAVVILQVGRWEPHKGHLFHVEALGALRDIDGWICWQVGAPQRPEEQRYLDRVRGFAEEIGIADRMRFLGWPADLPAIRGAVDVYCQPNIRPEPFGLTLVEALSAGLPVIACAEAGPLEIVTPNCGVLVTPGDVGGLAKALRRLLVDPQERRKLGAYGPLRGRELCDPAQQGKRLAQWLRQRLTHA